MHRDSARNLGPLCLTFLSRLRLAPLTVTILGGILAVGSLLWYQIDAGSSSVIGTSNIATLETTAYSVLALELIGLIAVFLGLTFHLRGTRPEKNSGKESSLITQLSMVVGDVQSARIFGFATLAYGLFFGVVSSTLVFQPWLVFSQAYGVTVPSVVPVVCCGTFGQMPQLVLFLTEHFAILVVPVNIILLFTVSWLVGLNAATANYAYMNRPIVTGARWFGGLGAIIGLFTACPVCAGFFLAEVLGLGGVVGLALTLSSLQGIFVAVGIPVLLVSPILMLRRIPVLRTCPVRGNPRQPRTGSQAKGRVEF